MEILRVARAISKVLDTKSILKFAWLYAGRTKQTTINIYGKPVLIRYGERYTLIEIFVNECYSMPGFEVQPGYTILDLGSAIGLYTLYAEHQSGFIYTLAVEPFPLERDIYQKNTGCSALPYAINGTKHAKRTIYYNPDHPPGSGFFGLGLPAEVKTITLTELLESNLIINVDLMKMDIQGAEYESILFTKDEVLHKIKRMIIECHAIEGYSLNWLRRYLERRGYTCRAKNGLLFARLKE